MHRVGWTWRDKKLDPGSARSLFARGPGCWAPWGIASSKGRSFGSNCPPSWVAGVCAHTHAVCFGKEGWHGTRVERLTTVMQLPWEGRAEKHSGQSPGCPSPVSTGSLDVPLAFSTCSLAASLLWARFITGIPSPSFPSYRHTHRMGLFGS